MNLQSIRHVHLMGICGTAMASLAGLLQSKGLKVTGSDQNFYPPMSLQLEKLKIPLFRCYSAENLKAPHPDLVIVGNVISRDNPEAVELMRLALPYMSLPQAMSQFMIEARHSIVIAGTHGKTTTTSLMAWMAEKAQLHPGFLVGGIPKNFGRSFQLSQGDWFVIEGDEYDTAFFDKVPKFIHYKPRSVILTSIEFDHADIYKDLSDVKKAFQRLLELIPPEGRLIYNGDDENIRSLLHHCRGQKISYGVKEGALDCRLSNIVPHREGIEFTTSYKGTSQTWKLPMFGEYNAMNATAVFALTQVLGWNLDFQEALQTFQGVKRRQELIGEPRGIQVIEDFAHHPTAVEQTLATFRRRQGHGKLHAVFEPRSATSRRKIFQKDYARAFLSADNVYIAKPYAQDKIAEAERFSSEELCEDINSKGKTTAKVFSGVDEIVHSLQQNAKPMDTIVIMSNGGFDGIYEKLLTALACPEEI